MDGLELLKEAQAAGLSVSVRGGKLVVRGPKSAEPLALRLLAHKPEVIQALRAGDRDHVDRGDRDHDDLTPVCRWAWQGRTQHTRFWESIYGVVRCERCAPPAHPGLVLRWIEPKEN